MYALTVDQTMYNDYFPTVRSHYTVCSSQLHYPYTLWAEQHESKEFYTQVLKHQQLQSDLRGCQNTMLQVPVGRSVSVVAFDWYLGNSIVTIFIAFIMWPSPKNWRFSNNLRIISVWIENTGLGWWFRMQ